MQRVADDCPGRHGGRRPDLAVDVAVRQLEPVLHALQDRTEQPVPRLNLVRQYRTRLGSHIPGTTTYHYYYYYYYDDDDDDDNDHDNNNNNNYYYSQYNKTVNIDNIAVIL